MRPAGEWRRVDVSGDGRRLLRRLFRSSGDRLPFDLEYACARLVERFADGLQIGIFREIDTEAFLQHLLFSRRHFDGLVLPGHACHSMAENCSTTRSSGNRSWKPDESAKAASSREF